MNIFNMMRNLLLGVFLGLFVVVRPTPVNTVTQISATSEEDIYHEVKAEEFILDPFTPRSVSKPQSTPPTAEFVLDGKVSSPKTESHQTPMVFQESQQLPSNITTEGSSESQTTPLSVSDASTTQSDRFSAFQVSDQLLTDFTTEGSADPTSLTKLFEGSGFFSAAALNDAASTSVMASTVASDTTIQKPQQKFTDFFTEGSGKGASITGFGEGSGFSPTTTLSVVHHLNPVSTMEPVKDSPVASTFEPLSTMIPESKVQNNQRFMFPLGFQRDNVVTEKLLDKKESKNEQDNTKTGMHKGHSTPDWMIIVGFIVALAALIAVCAAIATRDKWNHPNHVSETITNSSNQKRELEMQPFMPKVEPIENGNNGDYTIIPLDDAHQNFSSD